MYDTFIGAASFAGDGLQHWITSAVTSMRATFMDASTMNADLSGWKMSKVNTLFGTFNGAAKFVGAGLSGWDTSKVRKRMRTDQ